MTNPTSILQAKNLEKRYGRRDVVRGVDLYANGGEVVGLLGPNGAGKTTTFSMVAGLVRPSGGSISLNGKNITKEPTHKRALLGIGYLPQEASTFRKLTVEQNIRAIAETLPLERKEMDELVKERLGELKLEKLADQKAYTLSGGERRRLEITRALVLAPKFLLLDEPFSGVDPISVSEVRKIIRSLRDKGIGIFLTDHNVRETLLSVDRAYLLHDGRVLASGDADTLLNDPKSRELYLGKDFKV